MAWPATASAPLARHITYAIRLVITAEQPGASSKRGADQENEREIMIYKRYNDFDRLNRLLGRQHGLDEGARLPSKSILGFFRRFDDNFVQRRQSRLQR